MQHFVWYRDVQADTLIYIMPTLNPNQNQTIKPAHAVCVWSYIVYVKLDFVPITSPGTNVNLINGACSRKRFSEKQAEQWWAENRTREYERYNVHMNNKSNFGVGSEDLSNGEDPIPSHWHIETIICKLETYESYCNHFYHTLILV